MEQIRLSKRRTPLTIKTTHKAQKKRIV